jgi:D-aminoacyl-tRNA deacylase
MILLVASKKDVASLNIKQQILTQYPFKETPKMFQQTPLYTTEINRQNVTLATLTEESVQAQDLPEHFPTAKLIVFLSRHSSQSGTPTLTVHAPGNFGDADLGGLPKTLSTAPAIAMQTALKTLLQCKETLNLNYEVSYEATHHGPTLKIPCMFVELGSSLSQWSDSVAAQAVAHAAMASITKFLDKSGGSAVLGIGGPHYNQRFTTMALVGEAAFGHMVPKHAVPILNAELVCQCVKKTLEPVSLAILDWKGIQSEDKPRLLSTLESAGLPFQKV